VDIHERSVVVTLENIIPQVERDYGRDSQNHELLERSYTGAYACTRRTAETEVGRILNRGVDSSTMRIDLESGNAYMLYSLSRSHG
jgi:hypothetical protein